MVLVLINLSPYPSTFSLTNEALSGKVTELFSGEIKEFSTNKTFELNNWGYKVYTN